MESLESRFDSIQEDLLTIYEQGTTDLETLIKYWDLVRQENVIMHYVRQHGGHRIGMQQIPALQVTEANAKNAIQMKLHLESLLESPYGKETWTLPEVSIELFSAAPANTFKKEGFTVTVIYDNDESKEFPYVSWGSIYLQDINGNWHKKPGLVDYEGLYYFDESNNKIYYQRFIEDANKYGTTGQWEVKVANETISAPVTSSGHRPLSNARALHTPSPAKQKRRQGEGEREREREEEAPRTPKRVRLGREQGERGPYTPGSSGRGTRTREEADSSTGGGAPSPSEVGRGTTSVGGKHLSRLRRLQEEARDPAIIIVKGRANATKCWRNRCKQRHRQLFLQMSTVFQWTEDGTHSGLAGGRMLVAFASAQQRQLFLDTVPLPKGATYALGNLDSL